MSHFYKTNSGQVVKSENFTQVDRAQLQDKIDQAKEFLAEAEQDLASYDKLAGENGEPKADDTASAPTDQPAPEGTGNVAIMPQAAPVANPVDPPADNPEPPATPADVPPIQ